MKVSVSSRTYAIDDGLREEILAQIYFALSRFSPRLSEVKADIEDQIIDNNKPQRLCRITVKMKHFGSFVFEIVEEEIITAVSLAASRSARHVQRIIARERDINRWSKT